MERWALVSGLKGDLKLYEQIQRELQATRGVNTLFVLGDVISPAIDDQTLTEPPAVPARAVLETLLRFLSGCTQVGFRAVILNPVNLPRGLEHG